MSKNHSHLSGRQGLENNLFEAYAKAAEVEGSPSIEDLEKLRDEFLIGKSSVFGAVSFYDFLRPENKGKNIVVILPDTGERYLSTLLYDFDEYPL